MHSEEALPRRNVLVIGLGNILLRDEGIGVHLLYHLRRKYSFQPAIAVADGGTLGWQLMDVLAAFDHIVIIDAINAAAKPGTIVRFKLEDLHKWVVKASGSSHEVEILEVMAALQLVGEAPDAVVIGIVPEDVNGLGVYLSDTVLARVSALEDVVLHELRGFGVVPSVQEDVAFDVDPDRLVHDTAWPYPE
ncbi:Hydrogenase maturation protein [Candidatus Hydrogenisulfobacillus filiaventi]|uniref:Hydrogenase maturation protein n=1 Tax=Candidatus Hydrogenisulfobacillus filiaventi TaxID=2707344 RepID=A0A6F8ZFX8_9FIRM|nr:Hydrogenase maturation protein [Candidatus Hydrogenisulfobacillus filiaventi]